MGSSPVARTWSHSRLVTLDAVVAAVYIATELVTVLTPGPDGPPGLLGTPPSTGPTWLLVVLVVLTGSPLVVRRSWPVPVFAVVCAAAVMQAQFAVGLSLLVAVAYALYMVAVTVPRPAWEPTLAIGLISSAGAFLAASGALPRGHRLGIYLPGAMLLGCTWTVGRMVRDSRRRNVQLAAQQAARAVIDERLRIARELHDVITHSVGVIAVKASVANHVAATRPEETQAALRVIEDVSRQTLVETRQLLGVLRPAEDRTSPDADLTPQPGLSALPRLVEQTASAGVEVDIAISEVESVPPDVGLSVYRIVQEALTNVRKHTTGARCRVRVDADDTEVRLEVLDNGSPTTATSQADTGRGLLGMRERVSLHGGTLDAGPLEQGGFRVTARLPLRTTTTSQAPPA
jgi:signal transduction histidine kinase